MEQNTNLHLTSAERANLWATYVNDSMALGLMKYFINKNQDEDILPVLEMAMQISKEHCKKISAIFEQDNSVVPQGFSEEDINLNAPSLFFDTFYLHYVKQMSRIGITAYGLGISLSARDDIRFFYESALQKSTELDRFVTKILQKKGLYIRAPYINSPSKVEFVENKDFLGSMFGAQRPLLAVEITHLYGNLQTAAMIKAIFIGLAQVTQSKETTKWLVDCKEMIHQHMDIIRKKLEDSDLKSPMTWDDTVTDSTVSPFSEKLIMFQANATLAISLADFGSALAGSVRKDLGVMYMRFIADISLRAEEGAKIMIGKGLMEQPPMAVDRAKLAWKNEKSD